MRIDINNERISSPPLSGVAIEPTNLCNLQCKICFSQNPVLYRPRKKGLMDWKLYVKLIDELSNFGYAINLGLNFGGESMLHSKFLDMVKYAASKEAFRIGFTTNGVLLNDNASQVLVDYEINNITISLDGVYKRHESIRIGSNYNVVKNNIIDLVKKRGNKAYPKIMVNLIESEHTSHDITEFIKSWIYIVDCVRIYPCLSEELRIINPRFFDKFPIIKNKYCKRPFHYLGVLWNGDVTACCHDINGINILGNVASQRILDVWKGEKFRELRKAALINNFPSQYICQKCNAWQTEFLLSSQRQGMMELRSSGLCKAYKPIAKVWMNNIRNLRILRYIKAKVSKILR